MRLNLANLDQLARQHNGLFRAGDLTTAGYSFRAIHELVNAGILEKVDRGVYRHAEHPYDERLLLAERIPKGVYCLYSACFLHQLSDFVASEQHLAVPKKSRYVLPEFPPVQLYYWETAAYEIGIMEFFLDHASIRTYDREKTVCDMFRLRSKIGMDIVKEVLKNYLQQPGRDLVKLHDYARKLRVEKPLNQFLSILL